MKFNNRLTDEIYTSDTEKLGENVLQVMQNTIHQNGGIGTMTGYYDAGLPILSVSELLLHNLNHSYASLMELTKGLLKNLFYGENVSFLEPERFRQIRGAGEGQILTADGTPAYVRLYKEDTVDADGRPLWVLSVQVNWAYEDLALVNESIHSAPWTFECDETGRIVCVSWSHAFRQILGYHDAAFGNGGRQDQHYKVQHGVPAEAAKRPIPVVPDLGRSDPPFGWHGQPRHRHHPQH